MSGAKALMSDLIDARGRVNRAEKDLAKAMAELGLALDELYAATDILVAALAEDADAASAGRNAKRHDPQGHGPKDEHAVGAEGDETPNTSDPSTSPEGNSHE